MRSARVVDDFSSSSPVATFRFAKTVAGLDYPDVTSGSTSWLRSKQCAPARVVEQVLIQLSGHYFSLRENHGQEWIRTTEGVSQRIYSPPRLATSVPTRRLVSQRRP